MIGRSTALSAAHCYYQQGTGWIATNNISFGASNSVGPVSTPFGSYVFDSITLPGAWFGGNWDWDFAVLEFSPTRYPGDQTGAMGTEWSMSGAQYVIGYPTDKLWSSQWGHGTRTLPLQVLATSTTLISTVVKAALWFSTQTYAARAYSPLSSRTDQPFGTRSDDGTIRRTHFSIPMAIFRSMACFGNCALRLQLVS
jgi:hypothetical protein